MPSLPNVPRVPLAHLPTPVQPLQRLSAEVDLELLVKRDDLTGSHLSGNKIRKLEVLLAEALDQGATDVLTCGGVQSNHCRATALAAAPLGLHPHLLLRTPNGHLGDLPDPPTGNVLLDLLAGATLETCDPAGYRDRDRLLAAMAQRLRDAGRRPFIVPEGGSNAAGALGYVLAAQELADQHASDLPDAVVVATGSGGTVAGLAIGMKALGLPTRTLGVAVCDDAATFRAIVHRISAEATRRYGLPRLDDADFDIVEGFQGRGYALSSPDELELLRDTARRDGLVLDPVYTVKAFKAFLALARAADPRLGRRALFLHTGGLFGLFPAAAELAPHLSA